MAPETPSSPLLKCNSSPGVLRPPCLGAVSSNPTILPHWAGQLLLFMFTNQSCLISRLFFPVSLFSQAQHPIWPFRLTSVSQPGDLSGASDAISLLSPILRFLLSLQILPPHPASSLLPVLPSLLFFPCFHGSPQCKILSIKPLVHFSPQLPSFSLP